MAELTDDPYPLPDYDDYDDIQAHMEAEREALQELLDDPDETTIKFQIADGYAHYRIVSEDPLTLQHIPYGDAYRIPAAHIRGLRPQDVERKLEQERKLNELFG